MDINNINYYHIDTNFSAAAVTAQSVSEWVEMSGKQYWQDMDEKQRKAELTAVYNACKEAIKAALPKENKKEPIADKKVVVTDNDLKKDEGNNPDMVGAGKNE
jgi:hypothetical protein